MNSSHETLEITGISPEDGESYTYVLLPTGILVLIDTDGDIQEVTFGDYSAQLLQAQGSLSSSQTAPVNPERISLLMHLSLNDPVPIGNETRKNLTDAVMQFNNLFPEARPKFIPDQRFPGIDICPITNGAMAWNGIWASTPVNYWIFPTGQVYYFEDHTLQKVYFPTTAELCEELQEVLELEFLVPDLDQISGIFQEMIAFSVESDQEWIAEVQNTLDWIQQDFQK